MVYNVVVQCQCEQVFQCLNIKENLAIERLCDFISLDCFYREHSQAMARFTQFFVTLTFGLARSFALELSPEICGNISEVIVHHRDYYQFYLGYDFGDGKLYKDGMFYKFINNAVPQCCPNLNVTFVFKNTTLLDTDELVMENLVQATTRPRPYEFYFPEFAKEDARHVYYYELSFVRLKRSQGQAAVTYKPHGVEDKNMGAVIKIVNSSGLWLFLMLILSWLFGILGWATVGRVRNCLYT